MPHGGSISETWGDVLTQGLQESQKESIIDIRFEDDDVETYNTEGMDYNFA